MKILFLILLISSSCSIVNKQDKSSVSLLNGENLSAANSISGNIGNTIYYRDSKITGTIVHSAKELPLRNSKVLLFSMEDKLLKETISNHLGQFTFSLKLDDGYYKLQIVNKKKNIKTGKNKFKLDGFNKKFGKILVKQNFSNFDVSL